jgi:hypothetical protein
MEGEIDDSCSMHGLLKYISISVGKKPFRRSGSRCYSDIKMGVKLWAVHMGLRIESRGSLL